MPEPSGDADPDRLLAELGDELATRIAAVLAAWVVRCVDAVLPAGVADRAEVLAEAGAAGARARHDVEPRLRALLAADVDAQHSTPLELVRSALPYPTDVLRRAGVAPVVRDRFARERFPEDPYGLTPASLATVDPSLAEPALVWGAAKAMAHRRRHRRTP